MEAAITTLNARFRAAMRDAFGDTYADTNPAIRRGAHSDFQADVAMSLARTLGRPPRDVAAAIVERLQLEGVASRVEVAGPGFINVTLDAEYLTRAVRALVLDGDELGIEKSSNPETVVIDYSAPNLAKEMHVGHLRSTIIGDTLARVFEHLGHRVIRQNHVGDWGTPIAMLIEHLLEHASSEDSSPSTRSINDLGAIYQAARKKFDDKDDPSFRDRSRKRVALLQRGDEQTLSVWRRLVDESTRYFQTVYERLGVTLRPSDIVGESAYDSQLAGIVAALDASGLLRESDGAQCVFPPGFTNRKGGPLPLIIKTRDGGFGYAATDLAAIRHRTGTLGATRLLYVVGAPQEQHLAMVFAVARAAGWLVEPATALHVSFGSVLGDDKKMLKTRSGENVKLIALLDEALVRAKQKIVDNEVDPKNAKKPKLDATVIEQIARQVAMGAVKYADLSNDRVKDYVFDWDKMLAFEGNTGPYLQYAYARIQAIFLRDRAGDAPLPATATPPPTIDAASIAIDEPAERALAFQLIGFGESVQEVATTLQPHRLCTYLNTLAMCFMSFYQSCPVIHAKDAATRSSRLALADITARVLASGIHLLGIETPARM